MRQVAVLAVVLVFAGCRDFKVVEPVPPKVELGVRCASDDSCLSGVCLLEHSNEPICCEKRCADDETCWAPGHVGSCVLRLPGTLCLEEKDCPQALACVDQVCCLSHCAPWQACNIANHEGTCTDRNQFGEVCTLDAECPAPLGEASGHCVKGTCCTSACQPWEVCVEAGQRCAPERNLGDPCTASANCPPPAGAAAGFCVDGVCCDQACDGLCHSCARQGLAGTCGELDPNLDPRGDCVACSACFWGRCEPAVPGTDPKDDCAGAEVCSVSATCGLAGGAACVVGDFCSVGECVEGACLVATAEAVFAPPMSSQALRRDIYGLGHNGVDEVAAVFEEMGESESGSLLRHTLFAAQRSKEGRWTISQLDACANSDPYPIYAGGLVLQGRTAFIASFHSTTGAFSQCENSTVAPPPNGIWARQIAPGGAMGPYETIDGSARNVYWVVLRSDPSLGLAVAYTSTCSAGRCVQVRVREPPSAANAEPTWREVLSGPISGPLWDLAIVGGVPTVVLLDGTTATIHQPGTPSLQTSFPYPYEVDGCLWPAYENLQASARSRVNPTTGLVEEGLLFTSEDCPLGVFRTQAKIGTWWPSTNEWSVETLDFASMFGMTLGGPNAAVGMIQWDGMGQLGVLHHTWLGPDGKRQTQPVFLPPGFEDLATTSGAAVTSPAGTATYLVATGEQATSPVPRELYLVTLHR